MPPLKIDIHTHVLPRTWPDLAERYGCDGWPRLEHLDPCSARMMIDQRHFRDVKHNCWDVACRLEECDKTGVTAQVLSTIPVMFSYAQQPQHAHDLAQLLNEHIAEICRAKPSRFAGLGTLPMQSPDHAIRELEHLQFYCDNCHALVEDIEFDCKDIVVHFKQAMEDFWADAKRSTCRNCGTRVTKPKPIKRIVFEPTVKIERET